MSYIIISCMFKSLKLLVCNVYKVRDGYELKNL